MLLQLTNIQILLLLLLLDYQFTIVYYSERRKCVYMISSLLNKIKVQKLEMTAIDVVDNVDVFDHC